ncbi:hypothetical protein ACSSS7_003747 [Eimeria intestinalis]
MMETIRAVPPHREVHCSFSLKACLYELTLKRLSTSTIALQERPYRYAEVLLLALGPPTTSSSFSKNKQMIGDISVLVSGALALAVFAALPSASATLSFEPDEAQSVAALLALDRGAPDFLDNDERFSPWDHEPARLEGGSKAEEGFFAWREVTPSYASDGGGTALSYTYETFPRNCSLEGLETEAGNDPLGQHPYTSPPFSGSEPTVYPSYRRLRKLSSSPVTDKVFRLTKMLNQRMKTATRTFVYPVYEEARGQTSLSKLVFKLKVYTWVAKKVKKLRNFLQSIFPSETEETTILSDGNSTLPVRFTRELQRGTEFIDLLAQEDDRDWVGRFYVDSLRQGASTAMDKDFAILNCAPADESIESFRHRMRLDIPVEIYTIQRAGNHLRAPDGQIFVNAVARKPLIQASTSQIMKWFLKKLKNTKKGKSSLLSMSQQAVTAVSNLNRLSLVHTNVNPDVFLVTQKGLVFLGGLHQAVTEGSQLPQARMAKPGYTPPELRGQARTTTQAAFSQDAWQLGATLFTFWCGMPSNEEVDEVVGFPTTGSGVLYFKTCSRFMPNEVKDLIVALTQNNPENRILPEKAQRLHPAMRLAITDGSPPTVDLNQDDDDFDA